MQYVLDILLGALILFFIWRGIKKGFIQTMFGILIFALAGILSFMLYVPFSQYVMQTPVGLNMKSGIETSISQSIQNLIPQSTETNTANMPQNQENIEPETQTDVSVTSEQLIDMMHLPEFVSKNVYQNAEFAMRNTAKSVADAVSTALSDNLVRLLCGVALFVLLLIGLFIIKLLLIAVFKLPVLKEVNSIGGAIAGAVKGILIVYLLLAVIASVSSFSGMEWLANMAQSSYIFKYLYQNNIFIGLFL